MISTRNLTWVIPVAVFLASPLWYGPVSRFLQPRGGFDTAFRKPQTEVHDFTMTGVFLIQSKEGKLAAEIKADEAYTGDVKTNYIMKNVDAVLYSLTGEPTNIVSKKGIFYSEKEQLTLIDDVVVVKPRNNQRLYTDLLHYFDDTKIVDCPGNVRLVSDNVEVKGTSLHYDMNTQAYEITGRVYCTVKGVKAKP